MPARFRIRSRNDYTLKPGYLQWNAIPPATGSGDAHFGLSNYTYFEYFRDNVEISPKWIRDLRKSTDPETFRRLTRTIKFPAHECFHEKHTAVLQDCPSWHDWNNVTVKSYPTPVDFNAVSQKVLPVPDSVAASLGVEAFQEFHTQMPEEISIANFLYELKDLKGLATQIGNRFLDPRTQLGSKLIGSKKPRKDIRTNRDKLKGGIHDLNNDYLGYSFGVKPLLSDLDKLGGLVGTVLKRLAFLRATYGKPTKLHWRKSNVWTPEGVGVIPATTVDGQIVKLVLTKFNSNATAACDLLHTLEGLDGLVGTLRAFEAALGLNRPEKVIWNAIPYSFVIDWFARINDRLDQHVSQPFEGKWEVTNCSFSFREYAVVSVYAHFFYSYGNTQTRVGDVFVQKYRRFVGLPFGGSSLPFDSLSSSEQSLFGSLLFARTKK